MIFAEVEALAVKNRTFARVCDCEYVCVTMRKSVCVYNSV
jgi:hypothetical protein